MVKKKKKNPDDSLIVLPIHVGITRIRSNSGTGAALRLASPILAFPSSSLPLSLVSSVMSSPWVNLFAVGLGCRPGLCVQCGSPPNVVGQDDEVSLASRAI